MLYKDLVLLNNTLDNLTATLRKQLRKIVNSTYLDIYSTSNCFIYDFANKLTIGYYVKPETHYYIAYNPFTKHKLLLDLHYIKNTVNNIISIVDFHHLLANLLTGNAIDNYDPQDNIYINVNIIQGTLLQFLSKFNQIEHNFTDETYFENLYMLYKTLEEKLPKDKMYFYFITDSDFELLTENSKLLPFSGIIISTNYNLFLEIPQIIDYVFESIKNVPFNYLKPLCVIDNIHRYEDEYDPFLEYDIFIVFDNEIILDLIGIDVLANAVIGL